MDEKNFETKKSSTENDVIDFYDNYASKWDKRFGTLKSSEYFLNQRFRTFEKLIGETKMKSLTGLELGVGTGVYIENTAKIFKKIYAVDGSENMIKELNLKVKNNHISNVKTYVSNVLELNDIDSNSIDVVYFFGLIEHIIDIDSFIKEISRVLKDKGCVVGITPNGKSPWYKLRSIVRGTGKHCSTDHYFTEEELDNFFLTNSFKKDKFIYWGGVPAGVSDLLFFILRFIEKYIGNVFLKKYLGGISFKYIKNV